MDTSRSQDFESLPLLTARMKRAGWLNPADKDKEVLRQQ
jgi:hypothetical protein